MAVTFPKATQIALPDRGFGEITLSVHQDGEGSDRPAVVFSHGFPELGYSWRYQLSAVAEAGFLAVAPDQRGYGGSTAPEPIEAYDIEQLCGDLDAMCADMGIDKAVFVGHDWGGFVVWAMPSFHPDRVTGVVGVCTPMTPMPPTAMLEMIVEGDHERMYMLWFQEPGVAEAYMDPRADAFFEKFMMVGTDPAEAMGQAMTDGKLDLNPFRRIDEIEPPAPSCVSPEERAHYAEVFGRTGFRGGINWYRNIDRNASTWPELATTDPGVPCLMICAEWDPALPPAFAANMPNQIADLEMLTIPKAGHWVQQESPDLVNDALVGWLQKTFT
jgi:pimeloyl-ACP methyl ester carboxylesterase